MKIAKGDHDIQTSDVWMLRAPPMSPDHNKPGRSALELAKAWCASLPTGRPPQEIVDLVETYAPFRGATYEEFEPECKVRFDALRGEVRNADLVGTAFAGESKIAINIEGKADEPFDALVSDKLRWACDAIASDDRTFLTQRIQELGRALLPRWGEGLPHLGELRYQLLTGLAGSLAFAKRERATASIFAVHEFRTRETTDDLLARNQADVDRFIHRLTAGADKTLPTGKLLGPIWVRGNRYLPKTVPLFIGKARQDLLLVGT